MYGAAPNRTPQTRAGGRVVSRLFQHSPRQLRIARERLDTGASRLLSVKEAADPASIGRTRSEAEVRPPVKGHFGVRTHEVKSELAGTGALIVDDTPIAAVAIRGSCTKSSMTTVGGFMVAMNTADETERARWTSDNVKHGRASHLTGGAVVRNSTDAFMDADEIKLAAKQSNKFAPPCMIGGMQDFLGGGDSNFKPGRRQVEYRDEQMKETETGAPAVCDKYGRPWQQRQKQHYTPAELNNTLNQATTMDSTSSNECRRIAEAFPFEAHEQVHTKRGICARGPHPVSEENPMPMPEFTDRLSALAGGAKNHSYLIDPFGQLSAVDARSTMSKKAIEIVGNLKTLVAPWENPGNVDSAINGGATTVAERTPSLTGEGAIL
jgi:hypothetical protein